MMLIFFQQNRSRLAAISYFAVDENRRKTGASIQLIRFDY